MTSGTLATVDVQALREPGERKLLKRTCLVLGVVYIVCIGLTLSIFLLWILVALLTVAVLRSRFRAEAVEVGDDQLPRVWEIVRECATRMDMPAPRLFVSPDPGAWPIFTVPTPTPTILMHAHWVKMLSDDELAFFVYHELAHDRLGHRPFMNPVNVIENVGPVSWFLTTPLELMRYALRPWMRLADFSADRVALACLDGRLEVVAGALAKVSVGEELFADVDVEAFLRQARRLEGERLLAVHEVLTGRLGTARRLSRLASFAGTPEFERLCAARTRIAAPGLFRQIGQLLRPAPAPGPSEPPPPA